MKKKAMHIRNTYKSIKEKYPILNIVMLLFLVGVIIVLFYGDYIHGEKSIFNRSFANVPAFINDIYRSIPKIIDTISTIIISYWIVFLIKFIMTLGFAKTSRGLTIVQMLMSFIRWVTAITAVLVVLSIWGVDTTTLLASAGLLTLVIGLGAQSLVADIVAGIFTIFEGEYSVGDIVTFNDWRGTVKQVGIRTTQIESSGGDIKIINNSEIRQIINQTRELSSARCVFTIEYRESLQRVEAIINNNLSSIQKRVPNIIKGPFYKGVAELGYGGVKLLIVATCKEEDIHQVQRDLNREVKLLCEANNVDMAFSQVTINHFKKNDHNDKSEER